MNSLLKKKKLKLPLSYKKDQKKQKELKVSLLMFSPMENNKLHLPNIKPF